ncbi:hypothetical protein CMI46_02675 [Candidatus Pacearchaeota archaeon]|nr:hypothetical protein [Candidatus Pacearchaeota archaeon]
MKLKFNYKKIGSVMASAAMVGATMGIAAAASYPGAFTAGGADDVAIVSGSGAAASDFLAATQIGDNLNAALATSTITGSTPTGGDSVALEKSSTKFHVGKGVKDIVTTAITDSSPGGGLPTLLADGLFTDDDNDEFDYTQKIELANLTLTMFEDNDYKEDEPVLGSKISNAGAVLDYILEFTDQPEWGDLPTADIPLMGKEFYVLSSSNTTQEMTLLDSAVTTTLNEGESTTLNIDGTSYDVSISFIGTSTVKLDINGAVTNSLAQAQTQKVAGGAYVGIKDISVQDYAGGVKTVEFSIGSGKLKLVNNTDIELNEDSITDLSSVFTTNFDSTPNLQKINISWKAEDDLFIAEGSEVTMPGFEAVKLSYTGLTMPTEESIKIKASSDTTIQLQNFPLKDSVEDIDIIFGNSTNYLGVGKDADNQLATTNSSNLTFNSNVHDQFVASWNDGNDAESYLMRATNFKVESGVNKTTFQYKKNGVWTDAKTDGKPNDVVTIGNTEFTINLVNKTAKQVVFTAGTNVKWNTIYSKEGAKFILPWNTTTTPSGPGEVELLINADDAGFLNATSATGGGADPTTWLLNFIEEDKDDNIAGEGGINLTLGFNSASTPEVAVTALTYMSGTGSATTSGTSTEILDTDVFRNFVYSQLASEVLWNKPSGGQNWVELKYHGGETYGNFFISSQETVFTGGAAGATVMSVKDTESASVAGKNLIVVGGTCINTVAQELLGASAPLCGSDFTTSTGVGENEFLVETFARSGGKVATLVAGYQAADTTNAANALTTKTPTIEAGVKYEGDNTGRFEAVQ